MKHPKWIHNYEENFEQLAEEIGDLRYDSLEAFLMLLSEKIRRDGAKDTERGRKKLGESLEQCAQNLAEASTHIKEAWRISKPFMNPSELE